ncbi:MAG: phenylalanine--tRNA ligase subunit beta, partial [Candidatus Omnitrophica bacterium]|nr:phenylalanine--tRNA ligase subunit beta [Candidatus Omnitrophota bacterium]
EITSNRPDWLSFIGVAREVAAITGKKLKLPQAASHKLQAKKRSLKPGACSLKPNSIHIQDKTGCLRYIGTLIRDVEVKESPAWLKNKIESLGLRPVNNIVDITNFCLLEWGQPLHAFDFDKLLQNKIIVRRANKQEKIITIDGQVRELDPDILVIADSQKPVAIAGVMGGANTEVNQNTKNVFLESAYFDPATIRRASRKLGLTSDSSYRFERNVDMETVSLASRRATGLICELAKGKFVKSVDIQTAKPKPQGKVLLNMEKLNRILGKDIAVNQTKSILQNLGFNIVKSKKDSLEIKTPSFRQDVTRQEDLIEEVARIYGYQNIALRLPAIKTTETELQLTRMLKNKIREILVSEGLNEIISYSLISKEQLKKCNLDYLNQTQIANPLSKDQEILRPTAIAGLLNCLNYNFSRNIDDIKIFELGEIFSGTQEIPVLSVALTGAKQSDWLRKAKDKLTFFDLKGLVESLLDNLGVENYKFIAKSNSFLKEGISAILDIQGREIGFLGEASRQVLDNWEIKKDKIFIAQVRLDSLGEFVNLERRFKPLALYPSIKRDISLLINKDTSSEDAIQIIKKEAGIYLKNITLADFYYGQQIPSNFKSLTYSLEYQAEDRTLKDDEINQIQEKIIRALEAQLEVKVRR